MELLVLSACETAVGDETASLGLLGAGLRAGARSALGSLWSISDEATSEFMRGFYRSLGEPGRTKAESLRRAQRQLASREGFSHPFFWAPFVMAGNWL